MASPELKIIVREDVVKELKTIMGLLFIRSLKPKDNVCV